MIFKETKLKGAFLIEVKKLEDNRGFFGRAWCQKEFKEHSLVTDLAQMNVAFNNKNGILRGMHYQAAPYEEVKLVRCTRGAVYDVIIDLRPNSDTYKQWIGVELTADNYRMLYVPAGFAHGYQTLTDNSEIFYLVSEYYKATAEKGVRWDDSAFNIEWPSVSKRIISEKDSRWPDFQD